MKPLEWDLVQLLKRNRDGSQATQYTRAKTLKHFTKLMYASGAHNKRIWNLKQKDFTKVIHTWRNEVSTNGQPISDATLKNRVAALRWVAEKIGKPHLVPNKNHELGMRPRVMISAESKARFLMDKVLSRITSDHVKFSLRLQAAFGLRREEAMKIRPAWADRGDRLVLKASWTKGGRAREIPIRTREQREILNAAKVFAGNGSLIPTAKSYRQHLYFWENQTRRAGLSRTHGLRHVYAQSRYTELTGRKPPILGGMRTNDLSSALRQQDQQARLQIAQELGHSRIDITNTYLGR
jgi:hypothetical protein